MLEFLPGRHETRRATAGRRRPVHQQVDSTAVVSISSCVTPAWCRDLTRYFCLCRLHSVSSERIEDSFAEPRRVALASSRKVYDAPSDDRDGRVTVIKQPQFAQGVLEHRDQNVNIFRPKRG